MLFGDFPPSYVFLVGEGPNWDHAEVKVILNSKHEDSSNNPMVELVTQYVCASAHLSEEQAFELKRLSATLIDRLSPDAKSDSIGYCQRDHQTMPVNKLTEKVSVTFFFKQYRYSLTKQRWLLSMR